MKYPSNSRKPIPAKEVADFNVMATLRKPSTVCGFPESPIYRLMVARCDKNPVLNKFGNPVPQVRCLGEFSSFREAEFFLGYYEQIEDLRLQSEGANRDFHFHYRLDLI